MAMILDLAPQISAPESMILFGDTDGRTIWWAPKVFNLYRHSGKPAIGFYENSSANVAFLQMVFAPWVNSNEYSDVLQKCQQLGLSLNPIRYLGKNESGTIGGRLYVIATFPDDPAFRFQANGGQGGFLNATIPLTISMNSLTGQVLKGIVGNTDIGLVLQYGAAVRGATTTFHAKIYINYDRTYERLSVHTSWNWWLWSGDIQAAWQDLTVSGAVRVEILGGTADQKAIIYKAAEFMRDLFFKPELGSVTEPSRPGDGLIKTTLTYEKTHEHKTFELEFKESEFTEAPLQVAAFTGRHALVAAETEDDFVLASAFESLARGGSRAEADTFRWYDTDHLRHLLKSAMHTSGEGRKKN